MQKAIRVLFIGCFCLSVFACTSRAPINLSTKRINVTLKPEQIAITGPTQGTSRAGAILGITFSPISFLEAEQAALRANDSDLLIERIRYVGAEGLSINNIVIFGSKVYYVEGTGAKIVQQ